MPLVSFYTPYLFICIIYIFLISGSPTHKSQTRLPISTLTCINYPLPYHCQRLLRWLFLLILSSFFSRSSCPEVFSKKRDACIFIKKETLAQVLSREFCEIFKNSFFLQNTSVGCFCFLLRGECCEKNNGSLNVVSRLRISSNVDNFLEPKDRFSYDFTKN